MVGNVYPDAASKNSSKSINSFVSFTSTGGLIEFSNSSAAAAAPKLRTHPSTAAGRSDLAKSVVTAPPLLLTALALL
jgi:hypothetical protein